MLVGTEPQFRDGHISHIFWVAVDPGHAPLETMFTSSFYWLLGQAFAAT
jgi:hypothetical protein